MKAPHDPQACFERLMGRTSSGAIALRGMIRMFIECDAGKRRIQPSTTTDKDILEINRSSGCDTLPCFGVAAALAQTAFVVAAMDFDGGIPSLLEFEATLTTAIDAASRGDRAPLEALPIVGIFSITTGTDSDDAIGKAENDSGCSMQN